MLKTLKKEELAWKIIRDKKYNFFLVEVSLPEGTRVVKKRGEDKFRADQAMVNYITKIKGMGWSENLRGFLFGKPKGTRVQLTKSRKKVEHIPMSCHANNIIYEAGKMIKPDYFSTHDMQCDSGLHFYPANKIDYLEIV